MQDGKYCNNTAWICHYFHSYLENEKRNEEIEQCIVMYFRYITNVQQEEYSIDFHWDFVGLFAGLHP